MIDYSQSVASSVIANLPASFGCNSRVVFDTPVWQNLNMAYFNVFSKRQKHLAGNLIEIYEYDKIPDGLRIQITYIIRDIIGFPNLGSSPSLAVYRSIVNALTREYGVDDLGAGHFHGEVLFGFIRNTPIAAQVLDAVEISFNHAAAEQNRGYKAMGVKMNVGDATTELNLRLLDGGV